MKLALFILASTIIFLSFSKKEKEDPFYYKNIEKGMCLIPGGVINKDSVILDDIFYDLKIIGKIAVDSFYLCNHEVSNLEYREFLNSIYKNDNERYYKILPDTNCWKNETKNQGYEIWYLRHPAYDNYPVVGVSYDQAKLYCEWLTKKYMGSEKRKFKNVVFTLPTINQWTFAAKGGQEAKLATGNKLSDLKGAYLANFKVIDQEQIIEQLNKDSITPQEPPALYYSMGRFLNYSSTITVPIFSYGANYFKIFNLAGNVEEYVAEKGITKGGGWKDTGYFLQNFVCQTYDSTNVTSEDRGFRVAMEIVK